MPPISAAGDVVEKCREDEDDGEERQPALPVVRQNRRHLVRNPTLFEVAGEERETHQEQEQVRQDHPLMPDMQREPAKTRPVLEACEDSLYVAIAARPVRETRSV